MIVAIACIGLLLGNVAFAGFWKSEAVPTLLRCEYLQDPLGVDATQPRLSWITEAKERGWKQGAYHVLVASSKEQQIGRHTSESSH